MSLRVRRAVPQPEGLLGIAAEIGILQSPVLTALDAVFGLALLLFVMWGCWPTFPPAMIVLDEGRQWLKTTRRTRPP